MAFNVSAPLLELMQASGARPEAVNAVIDRRLARGTDTRMRPGDYYPSLLRRKTGVPIQAISRTSKHLCVVIESRKPLWRYAERSRTKCNLWIPVKIPEEMQLALMYKPVGALALTSHVIDDVLIHGFEDEGSWTGVVLRPDWRMY